MKKFCLVLSGPHISGYLEEILRLRRKFQTVYVRRGEYTDNAVPRIMLRYGSQIRELDLTEASLNTSKFVKILSSLPLLTTLRIEEFRLTDKSENIPKMPVQLNMLAKLTFLDSDPIIFKYFTAPNLKNLKLCKYRNWRWRMRKTRIEVIKNWMKDLSKLENLKTDTWSTIRLFDVEAPAFKLKKFFLKADVKEKEADDIFKFMKSQASSLEIMFICTIPRKVLQLIFTQFKFEKFQLRRI